MGFTTLTADGISTALNRYNGDQGSSDFDLNLGLRPTAPRLRDAAVLVPLIERPEGFCVLLTRRSNRLRHHPGQIAFPGGKVDEGDSTILAAALREANEEIGLPQDLVQVLGTLPQHETVSAFQVTPFVGLVTKPFELIPEAGEVDEVFEIPMAHFMEPKNFVIHPRVWQGIERRYFAVPHGPHYIWGATARILRMFCDVIGGHDETKH